MLLLYLVWVVWCVPAAVCVCQRAGQFTQYAIERRGTATLASGFPNRWGRRPQRRGFSRAHDCWEARASRTRYIASAGEEPRHQSRRFRHQGTGDVSGPPGPAAGSSPAQKLGRGWETATQRGEALGAAAGARQQGHRERPGPVARPPHSAPCEEAEGSGREVPRRGGHRRGPHACGAAQAGGSAKTCAEGHQWRQQGGQQGGGASLHQTSVVIIRGGTGCGSCGVRRTQVDWPSQHQCRPLGLGR